jgi:hypothetical protein
MNKKAGFIVVLLVMFVPAVLFAQGGLPCVDCDSPYGVTDVQVPFDDGVDFLIIAAMAYGVFRVWVSRRNRKLKGQLIQP